MLPVKVRELMSPEVSTLREKERLDLAHQIMNLARIRHMPVVDAGGALVGIVTQRDLFHSALVKAVGICTRKKLEILGQLAVEDVMETGLVTTTPDTLLVDAARLMRDRGFGCLPVVEDGKLVGILTERDFVRFFAERED